jgi:peptide methionine sulfoxide reductase MsrA
VTSKRFNLTNDHQPRVMVATADALALPETTPRWPGKVVTRISDAGPFWEAEIEDQEYLRHYPDNGRNQFEARPPTAGFRGHDDIPLRRERRRVR